MKHGPFNCEPPVDSKADGNPDARELKPDDASVDVRENILVKTRREERFALLFGQNRSIDRKDKAEEQQATIADAQAGQVRRHRTSLEKNEAQVTRGKFQRSRSYHLSTSEDVDRAQGKCKAHRADRRTYTRTTMHSPSVMSLSSAYQHSRADNV